MALNHCWSLPRKSSLSRWLLGLLVAGAEMDGRTILPCTPHFNYPFFFSCSVLVGSINQMGSDCFGMRDLILYAKLTTAPKA